MHLSPRVNKRASAPFELVHSDIWGPCLVMSSIGLSISLLLSMISLTSLGFIKRKVVMSFFLILVPFVLKF